MPKVIHGTSPVVNMEERPLSREERQIEPMKKEQNRRWLWLLLGATNVVSFLLVEQLHTLRLQIGDLWSVRVSLVTALLLLDNLIVVWVYTQAARAQAGTAQQQIELRLAEWRILNKPIVFLDRDMVPSRASADRYDSHYVARNVGPSNGW